MSRNVTSLKHIKMQPTQVCAQSQNMLDTGMAIAGVSEAGWQWHGKALLDVAHTAGRMLLVLCSWGYMLLR
jgi:hypothetical protein